MLLPLLPYVLSLVPAIVFQVAFVLLLSLQLPGNNSYRYIFEHRIEHDELDVYYIQISHNGGKLM